jgi:hypothetical protein
VYKSLPPGGVCGQKDNMSYFIFIGVIHLVFTILEMWKKEQEERGMPRKPAMYE